MVDVSGFNEDKLNRAIRLEPIYDVDGHAYPDTWIELLSTDSDVWHKHEVRVRQKRVDRITLSGGRDQADVEEIDEETLDAQVACTRAWHGFEKDGKPFPCTPQNAKWLYKVAPHIREQVNRAMGNRKLFFVDSPNGSVKPSPARSA